MIPSTRDKLRDLRTIITANNAIRYNNLNSELKLMRMQDRYRMQAEPINRKLEEETNKTIEKLEEDTKKLRNDLNNVNLNLRALPAAMPTPQIMAPAPTPVLTSGPSTSSAPPPPSGTSWSARPPPASTSGSSQAPPSQTPSSSQQQTPQTQPALGTVEDAFHTYGKDLKDHPKSNMRFLKTDEVDPTYGTVYKIFAPTHPDQTGSTTIEKTMKYDRQNKKLIIDWFDGKEYKYDATYGLTYLLLADSKTDLQSSTVKQKVNNGAITDDDYKNYKKLLQAAAGATVKTTGGDRKLFGSTITSREKPLLNVQMEIIKKGLSSFSKPSTQSNPPSPKTRPRSSSVGSSKPKDDPMDLGGDGIKKKKSLRTLYTGKAPLEVQSGDGIKYARGQDDKMRFKVMAGNIAGGNNNSDLKNAFLELADELYEKRKIKKAEHRQAYRIAGVSN